MYFPKSNAINYISHLYFTPDISILWGTVIMVIFRTWEKQTDKRIAVLQRQAEDSPVLWFQVRVHMEVRIQKFIFFQFLMAVYSLERVYLFPVQPKPSIKTVMQTKWQWQRLPPFFFKLHLQCLNSSSLYKIQTILKFVKSKMKILLHVPSPLIPRDNHFSILFYVTLRTFWVIFLHTQVRVSLRQSSCAGSVQQPLTISEQIALPFLCSPVGVYLWLTGQERDLEMKIHV